MVQEKGRAADIIEAGMRAMKKASEDEKERRNKIDGQLKKLGWQKDKVELIGTRSSKRK